MSESYSPGKHYTMGWNDRYSGKDKPSLKPIDWSDVMYSEYVSGYIDCSNKIMREVKEAHTKNNMNEGKQFIQE